MAHSFGAASSKGQDESESDIGFDDPFAITGTADAATPETQSPQMPSDGDNDKTSIEDKSVYGAAQDAETHHFTETPIKINDDKFAKNTPCKETVFNAESLNDSDIKSLVASDAIKAKILFTGIARASNDHSCHDHPEEGRRDKWGNSFVKYYSVNTKIVFYTTSITPWESKATVESCFG